ncbi:hypothetical protein B296_00055622 [Ensete ventricosum]|uniref:Uncharacterized protein n=1 Tax=Ensete ventricosum TaxID=4639 RepID=A0A426WZD4_ENSVE|nr:hypothetical protein B296_00055622 [Ensete ventricosum]
MDSRSECHGTARQVFRVCASNLASDESLGYRHMRDVYHQGRILTASTKESHGGDLIIQRYDQSDLRVGLLQCLYSLKRARQVRGQGRNTEVLKQMVERGEEAIQRSSAPQKQSVGQKGGGLERVPKCRRGEPTDREEKDADVRQPIVGPWARQCHSTAEIGLP